MTLELQAGDVVLNKPLTNRNKKLDDEYLHCGEYE